jgi:hypothetical protein
MSSSPNRLALYPEYMSKLLWGGKVVGLRVEIEKAPPGAVKDLIKVAWQARSAGAAGATRGR